MPLVPQSFSQIIDFTRTSAATFVNSSGNIASTPQSRNLLTFTQEFDNAAWTKTNATITANSTAAPDGTSTADTLVENSATSGHSASQAVSGTTIGLTYTATVYAKPNGRNWIILEMFGASTYASFNVATGTVGTAVGSPTTSITAVGNGWYRCTISKTIGGAITSFRVYLASADNTETYAGDGTSGLYLWGAQLEAASAASTYTRNNGGVYPPRFDYDPVTRAPRGLLIEEQRTNLLTYSEQFDNAAWGKADVTVSANVAVAPDGTTTADKLVENTTSATHGALQTASLVSGAPYTISIYAKAGERSEISFYEASSTGARARFNVSTGTIISMAGGGSPTAAIESVGSGWYRCSMKFTAGLTGANNLLVYIGDVVDYTGDGTSGLFIWGAQLEAGAFATSYIPTVASQVTRTADQAAVTGANFSRWYNQSAGSFVAEIALLAGWVNNANNRVVSSTAANSTFLTTASATEFQTWNGTTTLNATAPSPIAGRTSKVAMAYAGTGVANNLAIVADGGTVNAATVASQFPTVPGVSIGSGAGAAPINGHLRSIRYYPTRLSNAQLQALTA